MPTYLGLVVELKKGLRVKVSEGSPNDQELE
jgi:hypothetical protein